MNSLFTSMDISSKTNVTYLMKPDGSKHSSFSVQNNQGGAKILSESIVSALNALQLEAKVCSACIIAEIGDMNRFDSQASVAKYAGLVWSQHQSGEFEAEHTHRIKSGNRLSPILPAESRELCEKMRL